MSIPSEISLEEAVSQSGPGIPVSLPAEIGADEMLLRSVRKKDVNKADSLIKIAALKPGKNDRQALSLIRGRIGAEESVTSAKEYVHGEEFWGFGQSSASTLADHSTSIDDDRDTFFGHANMVLGYEIPPGPPNTPPEMTEAYAEARKKLIALAAAFQVVPAAP
jgi:hypothetical protein